MIYIFLDRLLILIMVFFSVMELFKPKDFSHRGRALIGTLISSFFLIILEGLSIALVGNLNSLLLAGLGVLFGVVYFYEGLTLWWIYLLLQLFRDKHSKRKELRRIK
ncbi:MAG: hypothetical protein QXN16_03725 [Candidatus Micrarchaeaceae archaeon]